MSNVVSIGIDIVELGRVREAWLRHGDRFLERICTPCERERARELADPTAYIAGRFSAKEAVLKVLGTGLTGGISWQHIHVHREPTGAPRVLLSEKALERGRSLGIGRILISISHGRDHAVAQAVGLAGPWAEVAYEGAAGVGGTATHS